MKSLQAELDNERTRVNELSIYKEELKDLRQNMKSVESVHEKYKEQIKIIEVIVIKMLTVIDKSPDFINKVRILT